MTASSNTKAKNLTNKLNLIMFEFFFTNLFNSISKSWINKNSVYCLMIIYTMT